MSPPDRPDRPYRPTVPHSMHRVPTGSQAVTPPRRAPEVEPEPEPEAQPPVDQEYDAETLALAQRIQAGGFSVNDLLALNKIVSRSTVVETRNDDRLRVDASVSLLDSKLDGALTQIIAAVEKPGAITKWKALTGLAMSVALTMGAIMASCRTGYKYGSEEAVVPAKRAEEKAEQAEVRLDDVAKVLANRIEATEKNDLVVEERLTKIESTIATTNTVLLQISAKLDGRSEPAKKKTR